MPATANHTQTDSGYSHTQIGRIALPMILSSLSTPLVGLADTALMGHLDSPAFLGAVAAGATIFTVLFMSLNFLRMGTTGIAAQAFGSGDNAAMANSLAQPMIMAALLGALMILLQDPAIKAAGWLLGLSTETAALTQQYFSIRVYAAPLALANFVLIGWLLGMQNARGPLAIMLAINLTNIALDLLFVLGFDMGIEGVALATLCAETCGLLTGILYVRLIVGKHRPDWSQLALMHFGSYQQLLNINTNLFFRSIALMFTLAFITARGARLGDLFLAANALLMNFQLFLSYGLDGIAHAAEALSGKAVGAKNRTGLGLAVKRCGYWTLGFALLYTAVYWLAGQVIINALTDLNEVRRVAYVYLPWVIISPLISAGAFLYDGVFVGMTRSREMRLVMTAATVLVFLPAWYLTQNFGNHGLWFAFTLFMATRSLAMFGWGQKLLRETALLR